VSFHLHRYLGLAAGKQTKEAFWPKPCSRASKQHVNSNPEHANISHYCTIEPQMKPRIYQTRSCCSCIGDRKLKNGNCRFSLAVGFISGGPFIIFFFFLRIPFIILLFFFRSNGCHCRQCCICIIITSGIFCFLRFHLHLRPKRALFTLIVDVVFTPTSPMAPPHDNYSDMPPPSAVISCLVSSL
jgi:hypothetical protein